MAHDVFTNGRSNIHKGSGDKAVAGAPDVCKTPIGSAVVPIPYPNISQSSTLKKGSLSVKINGKPACLEKSTFDSSSGDQAGRLGGIISGTTGKETRFISSSFDVQIEGQNAVRHADATTHNHGNTMGVVYGSSTAPSVIKKNEKPCKDDSDHDWEEVDSGQSPDDQVSKLEADIDHLEGKPSRVSQKRGYEFEKKAVIDNKNKLPIDKCSKEYRCKKCKINQEVDIVGGDRVAEAKSRKSKGVKKKSGQCKRLKGIQTQLFDPGKKPLAKIDGELGDVQNSKEIYERRGFEVEIVG
ncbi:hypothetical protein MNBD_GAMMA11-557 [hydrothermal vent metagenome]|uniref:Uncharacterized protein n=1 Tax=hydrothermal vent metagenome TaxID=652676 RepID=A0A3B0XIJ5_9ZZZZ